MDYRHEIKHIISPGDAAAIRANLSAVAKLDAHPLRRLCTGAKCGTLKGNDTEDFLC